jgi:hypothetical protein
VNSGSLPDNRRQAGADALQLVEADAPGTIGDRLAGGAT